MTGPDRIWAWPTLTTALTSIHADDEDLDTYGLVEYIRHDPAVLAALPEVQALIRQAVEAEREACAQVAHDWQNETGTNIAASARICPQIAAAIRKRGEG
ncbi:hypothetical protein GCM10007291_07580 [Gemmobacter nanjingensis]|uniref:Uncharacterized protein n=2 Tax=Gemmobacter nanjingensis TaxID=488454 RepID=A0ABQ3F814_9RHOB|nr:hypothetical protein GCM10007291_07580 [Gemmobacter nanjingensis]